MSKIVRGNDEEGVVVGEEICSIGCLWLDDGWRGQGVKGGG